MSLGIECGATKSTAIFFNNNNKEDVTKLNLGAANYQLLTKDGLEAFLLNLKSKLQGHPVYEIGIGMAGVLAYDKDKLTVSNLLRKIWPDVKAIWVGSDIEVALACLDTGSDIKIIVISGTGSNCVGSANEYSIKIGGSGHVLGDRGSGYAVSCSALRLALKEFEYSLPVNSSTLNENLNEIPSTFLIADFLSHLKMTCVNELVKWSTVATKAEIASLATVVINAMKNGNPFAKAVVEGAARELAEDCFAVIQRLSEKLSKQQISIEVGLTGSVFTRNIEFIEFFKNNVESMVPQNTTRKYTVLEETAEGALRNVGANFLQDSTFSMDFGPAGLSEEDLANLVLPRYKTLPQTECRNQRSMNLDTMTVGEAIDLMISEEQSIYQAIAKQRENIEKLINEVSSKLKNGGRLFYVGAGTSGRLGILDASECPPTFRTDPSMVQGIIAGGFSSVSKAKEGAEDSVSDGMDAILERNVGEKDVVIGIAASGRTPFVWGALYQAKKLNAFTAFITFNPTLDMKIFPDLCLVMDVGPEILTGSTRLKCGSATKCILNMLSTLTMVKNGKCFENLMVDLNPANQKLKQRALRIVRLMTSNLSHVTEDMALEILKSNNYDIKATVLEIRKQG